MTNIESFEGGTELLQRLRGDMAADPSRFHGKKTYVYRYGQCVRGFLTTAEAPLSSLPTADCWILGLLKLQEKSLEVAKGSENTALAAQLHARLAETLLEEEHSSEAVKTAASVRSTR